MNQTPAALQSLVDNCDFIELTNSQTLYPNSSGDGLALLRLNTPHCSAVIALQGAQLLAFTPKGSKPLLWLSPKCQFQAGKSPRGGIPVCLPWFGAHPEDANKPSHGFARTKDWQLERVDLDDNFCELVFSLTHCANDLFPHDFTARLTMQLGQDAKLNLEIHNTGNTAFKTSWALHTYFNVDDLSNAMVTGLEGRDYADKAQGFQTFTQLGPVGFAGEVDCVYENIQNAVSITGSPAIEITHYNCPSVVVWNPGAKLAATMSDVGAGNERGYICVERGAVRGDTWSLEAKEHRSAWIRIGQAEH